MRRLALILALLLAAPVFAQPVDPFDSVATKPGEIGGACSRGRYPGTVLIRSSGELWECPAATDVWTLVPLESTAVPAAHACTAHANSGASTLEPCIFNWTQLHTHTRKSAWALTQDEVGLSVTAFAGQSSDIIEVYRDDALESLSMAAEGKLAVQGAAQTGNLNVQGGVPWTPLDDAGDLEFWFRAGDISETCGDGGDTSEITSAWLDVTGNYTATPTAEVAGELPDLVCGHCCQWAPNCTTTYLVGCDCDAFPTPGAIRVHVESLQSDKVAGAIEHFDLSPTFTVGDLDTGGYDTEDFSACALIMDAFPATASDTGYLFSNKASGSGGASDKVGPWRDHTVADQPQWDINGNGPWDWSTPAKLGKVDAGADCVSDGSGEGPDQFHVICFTLHHDGLWPGSIDFTEGRLNGVDVLKSPNVFNDVDPSFTINRICGNGVRCVEILAYNDTQTTAEFQKIENYLSAKYGLGIGLGESGGAMDQDDPNLGTFIPAFDAQYASGTPAVTLGGETIEATLTNSDGDACTLDVESDNDLAISPAACDVTIAGDLAVAGVTTGDVDIPIRDLVNGTFRESFDALVTEAVGVVTLTIQQTGGGDLTTQFSDGPPDTVIDCTAPACTLTSSTGAPTGLTLGSDASPTENFVYVLQSSGAFTTSTSDWPATEHIKVAYLLLPSAAFVSSSGPYINQNWNDHMMGTTNQGHLTHMAERSRRDGAYYFSGVAGNGTEDYLTPTASNVELKSTAGIVYQMHKHTIPAVDTSGSDVVLVVNWSGDAYHDVTNLFDITADSTGSAITTNKYFNLVLWGTANKTGEYAPMMINLPACSYARESDALQDVSACDSFAIPAAFNKESSTGFLIARITIKMATTWITSATVDLRGLTPVSAAGASTGTAQTNFADNNFTIFDETDVTKIIQFQASGITTATTRTLTAQDSSGTVAYISGDTSHTEDKVVLGTGADADQEWLRVGLGIGDLVGDFNTTTDTAAIYFGGFPGDFFEIQYFDGLAAGRCNAMQLAQNSIVMGDTASGCDATILFKDGLNTDTGVTATYAGPVLINDYLRISIENELVAGTTQTQAGALQLTEMLSLVDIVATTNDSIKLPACTVGRRHVVINQDVQRTGAHTSVDNQAIMTDSDAQFPQSDALVGKTINNTTDGSSCVITANALQTVTCTLTGGAQNDWDTGEAYTITAGNTLRLYPPTSGDLGNGETCDACATTIAIGVGQAFTCMDGVDWVGEPQFTITP